MLSVSVLNLMLCWFNCLHQGLLVKQRVFKINTIIFHFNRLNWHSIDIQTMSSEDNSYQLVQFLENRYVSQVNLFLIFGDQLDDHGLRLQFLQCFWLWFIFKYICFFFLTDKARLQSRGFKEWARPWGPYCYVELAFVQCLVAFSPFQNSPLYSRPNSLP